MAVLLVVVYHVFTDRVSGGVDIFLFISAFFLTLSFTRRLDDGRTLALERHWLRVFTRLKPLAVVTILGTLALVAAVCPAGDRASWRAEGLASAACLENWVLAFGTVDYYAADNSTMSPFQHFWPLSVQGQVFLLWPLLFALAALVVRRTRLGVALPALRLPRPVRLVLGWGGLVSMVAVGMVVDVEGAFPGWIALWPLLSAAAVIVAGTSGTRFGLDRILSSCPLTALGDSADGLYLVHWPLLITYAVVTGRPQAGPVAGVAIILAPVGLAVLLTRLVERPLGSWSWPRRSAWRQVATVGVCLALVAAPVGAWQAWDAHRRAQVLAEADRNNPGAAALLPDHVDRADLDAEVIPLVSGPYPQPDYPESCPEHLPLFACRAESCQVLVPQEDPAGTVLMLGNSHVMQWSPALAHWAEARDLRVVSFARGSCLLAPVDEQLVKNRPGPQWLKDIEDVVAWSEPDVVFVQGSLSLEDGGERLTPGMAGRMEELADEGRQVLALRDSPRLPEGPTRCADGVCRPTVGNVRVYWDDNHLTPDYSRTLAPMFAERAEAALAEDGVRIGR